VYLIQRKIVNASINPKIFRFARDAVRAVPEHDELGEISALIDAIRARVSFRRDPVGIETIADADDTLEIGAGDCDDLTVLAGGALQSLGYPVEIQLVGDRRLSHVRPVAKTKKYGKVPVDLARPDGRFTSRAPVFPMSVTVPVPRYGVALPEARAQVRRIVSPRRPLRYGQPAAQPRTLAQIIQARAANANARPSLADLLDEPKPQPDPLTENHSRTWSTNHPFQMIAGVKRVGGYRKMLPRQKRVSMPGRMLDDNGVGSWLSDTVDQVAGHDAGKKLEQSVNAGGKAALGMARLIPVVGGFIADAGEKMTHMGESAKKMSWASIQEIAAKDPAEGARLTAIKTKYEAWKTGTFQPLKNEANKLGMTVNEYKAAMAAGKVAPAGAAGAAYAGKAGITPAAGGYAGSAAKKPSMTIPLVGAALLAMKFL